MSDITITNQSPDVVAAVSPPGVVVALEVVGINDVALAAASSAAAAVSESNAALSAASSATHDSNSAAHDTAAAASAAAASTSATNAAASATSAGTHDTAAGTSATNAAASAAAASTSATNAAASATSAGTHDTAAGTSATNAAASAAAASTSATNAAASAATATSAADTEIAARAVRFDAAQSLTAGQKTQAQSNMGLGSAAVLTAGVAANNVVQLNGSAQLPALNGSLLTGIGDTAADLTANYTVLTTDHKKVFFCAGNFTVTLAAPSGFTAPFQFQLVNNGTGGVDVNLNGTHAWLYPGQFVTIWKDGAAWSTSIPITQPYTTYTSRYFFGTLAPGCALGTAGVKVYVNQTSGNDDNDGLAAGSGRAFKTISRAWLALMGSFHHQGTSPIIQLAVENYNAFLEPAAAVFLSGQPPGSHNVYIYGDSTGVSPGSYQIRNGANSTVAVNVNDGCTITWVGIEFTSGAFTGCQGVYPARNVICDFRLCVFGAYLTGGYPLYLQNSAQVTITGNIEVAVGSANAFAFIGPGGWLNIGAVTVNCSAAMTLGQAFTYVFGSGANMQIDSGAVFSGVGAGSGSTGKQSWARFLALSRNTSSSTPPGNVVPTQDNGGIAV